MIPIGIGAAEHRLSKRVYRLLAKRQAKAMAYEAHQIDPAWKSFRATKAGSEVAQVLSRLFHCKCAYCEQEAAKDVEHFFPKSRYPRRMFVWRNFLWCCKNCNTEKLAVFPVDAAGNAVLLNPTVDEPLDYLGWDELSGRIVPHADPVRGFRATQTRDLLGLDQFSLAEERRNKLANVRYLLARSSTRCRLHRTRLTAFTTNLRRIDRGSALSDSSFGVRRWRASG